MKFLGFLLSVVILASGCAESEPEAQAEVMQGAASQDEAPAVEDQDPSREEIIEYVWHKKGPDFSEEALNDAATLWNGLVDNGEYKMGFANSLMAETPSEDMDFIWSIFWESKEARDAGWKYWQENQEAEWRQATQGLLTHSEEHAYAFRPEVQYDQQ